MSDSGKNAQTTYTGDGAEDEFALGFLYTAKADVVVKVSDVQKTRVTHWDFDTTGTKIVFVTAQIPPAVADNVVFTRQTDHTPVVTLTDGAPLPAATLDKLIRQSMYLTEEVEDKI